MRVQLKSLLWYALFVCVLFWGVLWAYITVLSSGAGSPADFDFAIPTAAIVFDGFAKIAQLLERVVGRLIDGVSGIVGGE